MQARARDLLMTGQSTFQTQGETWFWSVLVSFCHCLLYSPFLLARFLATWTMRTIDWKSTEGIWRLPSAAVDPSVERRSRLPDLPAIAIRSTRFKMADLFRKHVMFMCIFIYVSGWWFGIFFIFHIWDNPSHWLIFFKMVKTTNQIYTYRVFEFQICLCLGLTPCFKDNLSAGKT